MLLLLLLLLEGPPINLLAQGDFHLKHNLDRKFVFQDSLDSN